MLRRTKAIISENVASPFLLYHAVDATGNDCVFNISFANKHTSENSAIKEGVLRAIALSDHWRCVSIPKCARVSSRDIFAQETLESLSKTIEQLGVLEPLIVRASLENTNQYEIIAGERRFRAAKLAGLSFVPCLLSNYSNEQSAQIALIENTHREALNLIAEALAMKRLAEEFRYTHDEIGVLLGVSRAQVTNYLRLLTLEARVQHWIKQGALSAAHGKILAGVKYEDQYTF